MDGHLWLFTAIPIKKTCKGPFYFIGGNMNTFEQWLEDKEINGEIKGLSGFSDLEKAILKSLYKAEKEIEKLKVTNKCTGCVSDLEYEIGLMGQDNTEKQEEIERLKAGISSKVCKAVLETTDLISKTKDKEIDTLKVENNKLKEENNAAVELLTLLNEHSQEARKIIEDARRLVNEKN